MDPAELFNPFAGWFGSVAATPEGAALDLLTTLSKITVVRDPPSPLLKPRLIGVFVVPVPQANPKVLTLHFGGFRHVLSLKHRRYSIEPAQVGWLIHRIDRQYGSHHWS
jgi:hypothetical protein